MKNIAPIFYTSSEFWTESNKTVLKKRKDNTLRFGRMGKKFMRAKRINEQGILGLTKKVMKYKDDIIQKGLYEKETVSF